MNKGYYFLVIFFSILSFNSTILFSATYYDSHEEETIYQKYNQEYFDNLYDYNCIVEGDVLKPNYHVPSFIDVSYNEYNLEIKNDVISFTDSGYREDVVYRYNGKELGRIKVFKIYQDMYPSYSVNFDTLHEITFNNEYLLVNKTAKFYAISYFTNLLDYNYLLRYKHEDFHLEYNDDEFIIEREDNYYNIKALKTGVYTIKICVKDKVFDYNFTVFDNKQINELDDWYINNCIAEKRNNDVIARMKATVWGARPYDVTGPTYVDDLGNTYIMQYDKENNRTVGVLCLYLSYDDIKAMQNGTKYEYYHKGELRQIDYLFILDDLAYDVDFVFDKSDDRENDCLWYVMTDAIYSIEELIN